MLKWTAIFLVIAIVAAVFGFTGIAQGAASIAKTIFFILIVLVAIFYILESSSTPAKAQCHIIVHQELAVILNHSHRVILFTFILGCAITLLS